MDLETLLHAEDHQQILKKVMDRAMNREGYHICFLQRVWLLLSDIPTAFDSLDSF